MTTNNTQTGQAVESAGEKTTVIQTQDRTDLLNLEGLGSHTIGDVSQAIIKQMGMDGARILGECIVRRVEYMEVVTEKS